MIDILLKYEGDGWIHSAKHPEYDLLIWNYTQSTQYESFWDEITLMCRGLVTDSKGNIISRGFNKFFNWEENKIKKSDIVLEDVKLFEKVDGSYIGVFWYNNQWITNSKGSFTTEQAIKAKEHIDSFTDFDLFFDKSLTHNFEIIYPVNRIIVDYFGQDKLVYLSSTNKAGEKTFLNDLPNGMSRAKLYDFKFDYDFIKALDKNNEEGVVGYTSCGKMFKIKFDNYVKLHGLITRTSSYTIWECLRNGEDIKLLIDNIPDEFYDFVKNVVNDILTNYDKLEKEILSQYDSLENKENLTDKEFAFLVKDLKFKHQLFSLRNKRSITNWLWLNVKPEYKLPFSDECED